MKGKKQTTETLIRFIEEHIHEQELDCSNIIYKNRHTPVILICPKHGSFQKLPNEIFNRKSGCPRCGIIKRNNKRIVGTKEFISRANLIHSDKYTYENTNYINSHLKVIITCPTHGSFYQTPTAHIGGAQGCMKCYRDSTLGINKGGYSNEYFELNPTIALQPAMVYLLHITCATDDFLKVGITRRTIEERYQRTKAGDKYLNKTVLSIKYMSLADAYTLEQQILGKLNIYKYYPNYVFDGRTECFKNKPEVIKQIQGMMT